MKAITLRNLPPHVEQVVRRRAAEKRWSLNRTVVSMLEEAAGHRSEEEGEILEERCRADAMVRSVGWGISRISRMIAKVWKIQSQFAA